MAKVNDPHKRLIEQIKGLRRIVINRCYGGFSLSDKAMARYRDLTGNDEDFWEYDIKRDDPYLVQVVAELGEQANGDFAELKIVELPAEVDWQLEEYDGIEWIAEKHRVWK